MCGRYTYKLSWKQIVKLYRLTVPDEPLENLRPPAYNVAPTDLMPIVRPAGNGRELVVAKWGLMPWWLKPDQISRPPYATINARAESVRTARAFREPFATRRCLVPTTGWYEWQKITAKQKQPYHFRPKAEPFAFAGIYDVWKGKDKPTITSFSIVTTAAAPSVATYHDRMPLVLEEGQFDDWMRGSPELAATMMKPYPGDIEAWPVPAAVGNVRNNSPELMEPAEALAPAGSGDKN